MIFNDIHAITCHFLGTSVILDKPEGRAYAAPVNMRFKKVVGQLCEGILYMVHCDVFLLCLRCKNVLTGKYVSRNQASIVHCFYIFKDKCT
jgi:hypothetical protein